MTSSFDELTDSINRQRLNVDMAKLSSEIERFLVKGYADAFNKQVNEGLKKSIVYFTQQTNESMSNASKQVTREIRKSAGDVRKASYRIDSSVTNIHKLRDDITNGQKEIAENSRTLSKVSVLGLVVAIVIGALGSFMMIASGFWHVPLLYHVVNSIFGSVLHAGTLTGKVWCVILGFIVVLLIVGMPLAIPLVIWWIGCRHDWWEKIGDNLNDQLEKIKTHWIY